MQKVASEKQCIMYRSYANCENRVVVDSLKINMQF